MESFQGGYEEDPGEDFALSAAVSEEHFSGWDWSLRTWGTGGFKSTLLVTSSLVWAGFYLAWTEGNRSLVFTGS